MADTSKGSSNPACNDSCGCPSPCAGADSCKCRGAQASGGDSGCKMCSCGAHCGCNPCTCSKAEVSGTGKANCKCGQGCSCTTCAA